MSSRWPGAVQPYRICLARYPRVQSLTSSTPWSSCWWGSRLRREARGLVNDKHRASRPSTYQAARRPSLSWGVVTRPGPRRPAFLARHENETPTTPGRRGGRRAKGKGRLSRPRRERLAHPPRGGRRGVGRKKSGGRRREGRGRQQAQDQRRDELALEFSWDGD